MAKLKLNKNSLREQKQQLGLYGEFLPTLELRKQQLQGELRQIDRKLAEEEAALAEMLAAARPWSPLIERYRQWIAPLVVLEEVELGRGNVAGVRVPILKAVRFADVRYSLIGTPALFDDAIALLQGAIAAREGLAVRREQRAILRRELLRTKQRINLYEKVLIPQTKENIRRIKVYLGDQQTAAMCRAKIAKARLVAKAAARQAGGAA